ncbi:hypothetical protein HDE_00963 [Halotydeus destructor]|nr:hypothetical protein HDE_00963 [Halotydeus destructor]
MRLNVKSIILDIVGPSLEVLLAEPYQGESLFEDEDFVIKLATQCPRLGDLPIVRLDLRLRYCELNGQNVKRLELYIHEEFNEMQEKLLKLCPNLKKLVVSLRRGSSIAWVRDTLASRTNCLEELNISYDEPSFQLSEEIQSIVSASLMLKDITVMVSNYVTDDPYDNEMHVELASKLPQLSQFDFKSKNSDLSVFGPFATSFEVSIENQGFSLHFLNAFSKLTHLYVDPLPGVEVFNQLIETLPMTVTAFKTHIVGRVQYGTLRNLVRQRGSQLTDVNVTFARTYYDIATKKVLVEIANHCPDLIVLSVKGFYVDECSQSNCSRQFKHLTSKLTNLRDIYIACFHVSRSAFESALFYCRHLENIRI